MCISSKQTEICFVHMGTSSQQHVPRATAEFGAGREDQYWLSEDVCCLVSLLVASFGQGCEPVGLTQTELSPVADAANGCFHRVSSTRGCLPPH